MIYNPVHYYLGPPFQIPSSAFLVKSSLMGLYWATWPQHRDNRVLLRLNTSSMRCSCPSRDVLQLDSCDRKTVVDSSLCKKIKRYVQFLSNKHFAKILGCDVEEL